MPKIDFSNIPKQKIYLAVGIILAILAIVMTKVYIDNQRKVAMDIANKKLMRERENSVSVLIANRDIPRGLEIDPGMFDTQVISKDKVYKGAATSLDSIAGMATIAPISRGEQILLNKLAVIRQAGGLSEVTPIGKRAITISVDNLAALAGMIRAGDYVDVLAMIPVPVQTQEGKAVSQLLTLPLFQNIQVLAVGQDTSAGPKQQRRYEKEAQKEVVAPLITLALNPQEANLIAFVQEQGKIRLIMRSPADSKVEPIQPANWDSLLNYIMPKKAETKVEKKREEPEPIGYVEIYRGLSKERVPLYK